MMQIEALPQEIADEVADEVADEFRRVMREAGFNRKQASEKDRGRYISYKNAGFRAFTRRASKLLGRNSKI